MRSRRLTPQDRQLVPQNDDLQLLRSVAAAKQPDELESTPSQNVNERYEHRRPPRTGRRRYRAEPSERPTRPGPRRSNQIEFVHPTGLIHEYSVAA